ncbi:SpdD-like protein [Streptomyces sp. NPDC088252]|uniref:SpdD-like protein n=1 Tax=unclassified Streptomyces TaxID=2593676 RepID=UPI003813AF3F
MFKPRYPHSDTHTFAVTSHTSAPLPVPTEHTERPATEPVPVRRGVVDIARANPVVAVTGVVAVGAVVTSMLLAVAVTALALSISGVVLLVLVRMLRQEFHR